MSVDSKSKKDCPDPALIIGYALKAPLPEEKAIEEHIDNCDSCFELMLSIRASVDEATTMEPVFSKDQINEMIEKYKAEEKKTQKKNGRKIHFLHSKTSKVLAIAASLILFLVVNYSFERDKIEDFEALTYLGEPVRSDTGIQYDYTTLFDTDKKIHTGIRDDSLIITWDSEIDPQSIKLSDEYSGDEIFSAEVIIDNEISVPLNTLEIDKNYLLEIIGTLPGDIHVRFEQKLKTGKKGLFF